MGSEQFYGYRLTGQRVGPTRLIGPHKSEARDSPKSPFLTPFDSDTFTTLSSGASPSSSQSSGVHYMKNALLDIETTLMAPDEETALSMPVNPNYSQNRWAREPVTGPDSNMARKPRKPGPYGPGFGLGNNDYNLKELLIACARALAGNELDEFAKLVEFARGLVSITGDPIQRLGAYMVEGLVARKELSGNNICRALRCREPEGKDLLSYMHILYETCPYLKFGYLAANGAIAEACRNEDRIHIIDFQIAQGTQWITLLQALAARPGGPPHVRITGIDDPVSKYARGDGLEKVGKRLDYVSKKFNIPVEFHPLPVYAPYVTEQTLNIRPGEALAVNFALQLHHMPDESVDVKNPRDEKLRLVKSLSPKIVTLVEQDSNTNTSAFFPRFTEALDFYTAVFESMDASLPRDRKERINVEQHCLARDIVNVIACEGKERVERHELFRKWRSRFVMAGFKQIPLSSYVNSVIIELLKYYSEHYTLVEKDGAMLLGWKDRSLISASAWC